MLDSMARRHRKPRSGSAPRRGSTKLAPGEARVAGQDAIRGNRPLKEYKQSTRPEGARGREQRNHTTISSLHE
jgi:hypothetical protein